MRHGGNKQIQSQAMKGLRNYRLTKFKGSVDHHINSSGLKTLRDEIAILRVILEERLNSCSDTTELIMYSGPISELVMKIEKIVVSCNKLEQSMSMVLDKQALLQFASETVRVISEELGEVDNAEMIMEKIADRIISNLKSEE